MTAEQTAEVIKSMKRSVEILKAVARNCEDIEAADDIAREANLIAARIVLLEGTPQTNSTNAQRRAA